MNIQDAAHMLRSGCFVRRVSWVLGKHCGLDGYGLYVKTGTFESSPQMHFVLSLDDLLAEDWEVYIPAYPTRSNRPTFRPSSGRPDRPSFPAVPSIRIKEEAAKPRDTVKPGKNRVPLVLKKK